MYGLNLGEGDIVKPGEAVGIIGCSIQSGEPGTQFTLRNFPWWEELASGVQGEGQIVANKEGDFNRYLQSNCL